MDISSTLDEEAEIDKRIERRHLEGEESLGKQESGRTYKTKSGIRVRSKIEKIIADYLFERGIRFTYEPVLNLGGFSLRPDFYLTDFAVYLEHFGREDPEYTKAMESKLERYERTQTPVICTYRTDEPDIEEILRMKLKEVGISI